MKAFLLLERFWADSTEGISTWKTRFWSKTPYKKRRPFIIHLQGSELTRLQCERSCRGWKVYGSVTSSCQQVLCWVSVESPNSLTFAAPALYSLWHEKQEGTVSLLYVAHKTSHSDLNYINQKWKRQLQIWPIKLVKLLHAGIRRLCV